LDFLRYTLVALGCVPAAMTRADVARDLLKMGLALVEQAQRLCTWLAHGAVAHR
jgi:hypothetical protein